jgi:hypothetical protein
MFMLAVLFTLVLGALWLWYGNVFKQYRAMRYCYVDLSDTTMQTFDQLLKLAHGDLALTAAITAAKVRRETCIERHAQIVRETQMPWVGPADKQWPLHGAVNRASTARDVRTREFSQRLVDRIPGRT